MLARTCFDTSASTRSSARAGDGGDGASSAILFDVVAIAVAVAVFVSLVVLIVLACEVSMRRARRQSFTSSNCYKISLSLLFYSRRFLTRGGFHGKFNFTTDSDGGGFGFRGA